LRTLQTSCRLSPGLGIRRPTVHRQRQAPVRVAPAADVARLSYA